MMEKIFLIAEDRVREIEIYLELGFELMEILGWFDERENV